MASDFLFMPPTAMSLFYIVFPSHQSLFSGLTGLEEFIDHKQMGFPGQFPVINLIQKAAPVILSIISRRCLSSRKAFSLAVWSFNVSGFTP